MPVNCTYLKFGFQCFYNIPFFEYVPTFQFFSQNDKFSHPKAVSMTFSCLHVYNIWHQPRKLVIPLHHIKFSLAVIINQNVLVFECDEICHKFSYLKINLFGNCHITRFSWTTPVTSTTLQVLFHWREMLKCVGKFKS